MVKRKRTPGANSTEVKLTLSLPFTTTDPLPNGVILPIPSPEDELSVIADKSNAILRAAEQGYSIAVVTNYAATPHQSIDPVAIARKAMTPQELHLFDAWPADITLPPFNWDTDKQELTTGKRTLLRMQYRAAAMNELYKTTNAQPEHAMWLTMNMTYTLPLFKAMERVEGAKRALLGGQTALSELELAEYQTCRKMRGIMQRKVEETWREFYRLGAGIDSSIAVIKARADALERRYNAEG